jgi:hypothetical protein
MPVKNLPVIRILQWSDILPEFTQQAVNEYYKPAVDFGLFTHN